MKKEAQLAQNKPDRIKCRQAYVAALALHACDSTDQPRCAAEVAAQAVFYGGPWQRRCVVVEVRVRCPSSSLRGVVRHG